VYKLDGDGSKLNELRGFIQQSKYVVVPKLRDEEHLYLRVKPNPTLVKKTGKIYYLAGATVKK
jgi:hypothetical protein